MSEPKDTSEPEGSSEPSKTSEPEGQSVPAYVPKTDAELEQLAQDLVAGQIFTSEMVENIRDAQMVFMPLALMDKSHLQWFIDNKIVFFYEYLHKAGPRSFNGMPIFYSMNSLNEEDAKKLWYRGKEIHEFLKARNEAVTREGKTNEDA